MITVINQSRQDLKVARSLTYRLKYRDAKARRKKFKA